MRLASFLTKGNIVVIGEWQLNIDQQSISDGDNTRELEPLLFKLLCHFIEHNGRIIPRQELAEKIWLQSYVDDNAINRAISELRKALKSAKQPGQSIKTHYRTGYSLFIPVIMPEATPIIASTESVETIQNVASVQTNTTTSNNTNFTIKRSRKLILSLLILLLGAFVAITILSTEQKPKNQQTHSAPTPKELKLSAQTISWHKGTHYNLRLSPHKDKLAFLVDSMDKNTKTTLYIINLETGKELLIDSGYLVVNGWSHDSERLFYTQCKNSTKAECEIIQASDLLSAQPKLQHLNNPLLDANLKYIFDYTEIDNTAIFSRNNYRNIAHLTALYSLDLDTKEEIRITNPNINGTGDLLLAVIPNPSRIIYERHQITHSEIYMSNLDGSSPIKLIVQPYRIWVITYDRKNNELLWYDRHTSTIESYSLDEMQMLPAIHAPIARSNYAFSLSKNSILNSTDLHDHDLLILDLDKNTQTEIANPAKNEANGFKLEKQNTYFQVRNFHGVSHWLKHNSQYKDITSIIGKNNRVLDADLSQNALLIYNKEKLLLTLLNTNDFSVIEQWPARGSITTAKINGQYIALLSTDKQMNSTLNIYDRQQSTWDKVNILMPFSFDWINSTELIVNNRTQQLIQYDMVSHQLKKLSLSKELQKIKQSLRQLNYDSGFLYFTTETDIYRAPLDKLTKVETVFTPSNKVMSLILGSNIQDNTLHISVLTAQNKNYIELYKEAAKDMPEIERPVSFFSL
ncbi:winged helix-turn-helix domain-containing protein [Pseudoalteromonas sp. SG45-5]|uniref:winged helix-turn-helix domain-containing protein n=1 Tax=unclassified Pseudoalteromonas TaxID=194690 RepID=UPI0015FC313E|nr:MULTISPECIES: winged helix-turn-helix domain-containing protein [unclassified Pseudoalteromonas]MBB1384616.1 winged helix-turn-helix domain-containing protein [Pseudoalteromonas sp. SG45-5]MBB1394059.1 winged helix-turn-helix domain-containing protein [Pseudoalteromonas sp. SG44-4]MBB1446697.1 winged helix-turn-helix domain-containing protein [Pseudoalteromonas sp. SG41-6]